jgi:tRNA nucleotidyltransferase/poly(A) polymerase
MLDIQIRALLLKLLNFSSHRKMKIFVVGGTLRDHILRKNISDIDLTGKKIAVLATLFAKSLDFNSVPLDKTPGRATTRIILPDGEHFDCTDLQGNKIEEDLLQRDFTINAMGQELSNFLGGEREVIDPLEGQKDIEGKFIRIASSTSLESDPLRMLRAFRFAATLKFTIDERTLKEISLHKEDIAMTASERVWQELYKFFNADNTEKLTSLMKETGLLFSLLPYSFSDWKKISTHYNRLEHIILNPDLYFPKQSLTLPEKALLKFALLLKGIDTKEFENSNSKDFGLPKTYEFLRVLKVSNSDIAFICKSIQNFHLFSKSIPSKLNDSSLYDICVTCGDKILPGILLQACTLPFHDKFKNAETNELSFHTKILDFYFLRYLPALGEKALLNGDDLIKNFNIAPSPVLGDVLQNIQRAQVLGNIKNPAEAKAFATKILQSQKQKLRR